MSVGEVFLDGALIRSEAEFHSVVSELLDFGPWYGRNLDALWDRLSTDVERPVRIIWLNSALSKNYMGSDFEAIVRIFERVRQSDLAFNWNEKFDYVLK